MQRAAGLAATCRFEVQKPYATLQNALCDIISVGMVPAESNEGGENGGYDQFQSKNSKPCEILVDAQQLRPRTCTGFAFLSGRGLEPFVTMRRYICTLAGLCRSCYKQGQHRIACVK